MRIPRYRCAGLATIVAAALFVAPVTAVSQPIIRACGPDGPGLLAHLDKEGERVEAVAFTASGKLVYVMVDPEDREYSIVTVAANNEGCLISVGHDWQWLGPER